MMVSSMVIIAYLLGIGQLSATTPYEDTLRSQMRLFHEVADLFNAGAREWNELVPDLVKDKRLSPTMRLAQRKVSASMRDHRNMMDTMGEDEDENDTMNIDPQLMNQGIQAVAGVIAAFHVQFSVYSTEWADECGSLPGRHIKPVTKFLETQASAWQGLLDKALALHAELMALIDTVPYVRPEPVAAPAVIPTIVPGTPHGKPKKSRKTSDAARDAQNNSVYGSSAVGLETVKTPVAAVVRKARKSRKASVRAEAIANTIIPTASLSSTSPTVSSLGSIGSETLSVATTTESWADIVERDEREQRQQKEREEQGIKLALANKPSLLPNPWTGRIAASISNPSIATTDTRPGSIRNGSLERGPEEAWRHVRRNAKKL